MNQPDYYYYPAVFGYEEGEEISVCFPDLGVSTSGENDADALKSARELLGLTMWGIEDDKDPVPAPSKLNSVPCSRNERAVLVDVYMPSVRLSGVSKSVDLTVTLPAWLNAAALERNINFSQLLQEAIKVRLNVS